MEDALTRVAYYMWAEFGKLPSEMVNLPPHEFAMILAFIDKKAADMEAAKNKAKSRKGGR